LQRRANPPIRILLTGRPGCGKTTVLMHLAELLEGRAIAGFYTQEIRKGGQRWGFGVRTLSQHEGILSSVDLKEGPSVGRYRVDVDGFERLVLAELNQPAERVAIYLIDEIGKMECFSRAFVESVRRLLATERSLVATVAQKGAGFIEEVKAYPGTETIEVTLANRGQLPGRLARRLLSAGLAGGS